MPYATIRFLKKNQSLLEHSRTRLATYEESSMSLSGYAYFEDDLYFPVPNAPGQPRPFSVCKISIRRQRAKDNSAIIYAENFECNSVCVIPEIKLLIDVHDDIFLSLIDAEQKQQQVEFVFKIENSRSDALQEFDECELVEINSHSSNNRYDSWFSNKLVKQVERILRHEFCGDQASGQVPLICSEMAKTFNTEEIFDCRHDLLPKIFELLTSIRDAFEGEAGRPQVIVQTEGDAKSKNLFELSGTTFKQSLLALSDKKTQRESLEHYNRLAKKLDIVAALRDGPKVPTWALEGVAESYIETRIVKSRFLESLLIERLLVADLVDVASEFIRSHNMPPEVIENLGSRYYNKELLETSGKSILRTIRHFAGKSIWKLAAFLIGGLITWWWTSLIAGDNEIGHYILFGTIFSAGLIVRGVGQRDPDAVAHAREELNYYVLRDIHLLILRVPDMNVDLIKSLMLRLEARGVRFNPHVYELLSRSASHETL